MSATYIKYTGDSKALQAIGIAQDQITDLQKTHQANNRSNYYLVDDAAYIKLIQTLSQSESLKKSVHHENGVTIDLTPQNVFDFNYITLDQESYERCLKDVDSLKMTGKDSLILQELNWVPDSLIGKSKIFLFQDKEGQWTTQNMSEGDSIVYPAHAKALTEIKTPDSLINFIKSKYKKDDHETYYLFKTALLRDVNGIKTKEIVPVLVKVDAPQTKNQDLINLAASLFTKGSYLDELQLRLSFLQNYNQLTDEEQKIVLKEVTTKKLDKLIEQYLETGDSDPLIRIYSLLESHTANDVYLAIQGNRIQNLLLASSNLSLVALLQSENSKLNLNVGREIYNRIIQGISSKEFDTLQQALLSLKGDPKFSKQASLILQHPLVNRLIRSFNSWPPKKEKLEDLMQYTYKEEVANEDSLEAAYLIYTLIASYSLDVNIAASAKKSATAIANNDFSRIAQKWWDGTSGWEIALTAISVGGAFLRLGTLGLGLLSRVTTLSSVTGFRQVIPGMASAGVRFLSDYRMAATLLAADTYMMGKHAPQVMSNSKNIIDHVSAGEYGAALRETTSLAAFIIGAIGLGVGFNSFKTGILKGWQSFKAAAPELTRAETINNAFIHGDTWRRLMEDPQFWIYYAKGAPTLTATQKSIYSLLGRGWDFMGIKGMFGIGTINLVQGIHHLSDKKSAGLFDWVGLLGTFAMDVIPATGTLLYRAGRGSRHFNLGPVPSQENPDFTNQAYRKTLEERVERAIPQISKEQNEAYIAGAKADLAKIREHLDAAKMAEALTTPRAETHAPVEQSSTPKAPKTLPPRATWVHRPQDLGKLLADFDVHDLHHLFLSGELTPQELIHTIIHNHDTKDSTLFARGLLNGPLARKIERLARESTQRYKAGKPLSLYDGLPVPSKDLKPDLNGKMQVGSKSAFIDGFGLADMTKRLLKLGAIPLPVGMVAGANGGSGANNGWGYTPNPKFIGKDPAGSSSVSAYMVGRSIVPLAEGTDTGGSIKAPAGACDIVGFVPPKDFISRDNLVPFAQHLDHVGVLSKTVRDAMEFVYALSPVKWIHSGTQPHKPVLLYSPDLVKRMSPTAQSDFHHNLNELQQKGYQVQTLSNNWDFAFEVPMLLYAYDAYPNAAYNHFNPHQENRLGEAPRYTLDDNLNQRFRRGLTYLQSGIYDEAVALNQQLQQVFREKFGTNSPYVIVSPAAEAIDTHHIFNGTAGKDLDNHDRITMLQNRIDELATLVTSSRQHAGKRGLSITGHLPAVNKLAKDLFF